MRFEALPLKGTFLIHHERHEDARGHFARTYCAKEFARAGLVTAWLQCNTSYNRHAGTLRGLHWQVAPHEEAKIIRVTRGSIYDVMVDIRPTSSTYCKWHAEKIHVEDGVDIYVPTGFAHGFLTLSNDTEVFYHMSANYEPNSVRGARFDDPAFEIEWPNAQTELLYDVNKGVQWSQSGGPIVSDRDKLFSPFVPVKKK